jgi:hypothetical protein
MITTEDPHVSEGTDNNEYEDISEEETTQSEPKHRRTFKYKSSHPEDLIVGNKDSPVKTRLTFKQNESLLGLISLIEPTNIEEALMDDGWIIAMQEELNQFERNDV